MELTSDHREILERIGSEGMSSDRLGELPSGRAFAELVDADYIRAGEPPSREAGRPEPVAVQSVTHWILTQRGLQVLNVPPFDE